VKDKTLRKDLEMNQPTKLELILAFAGFAAIWASFVVPYLVFAQ